MNNTDIIITVGTVVVIGAIGYIAYETLNSINSLENIPQQAYQNYIETPALRNGANSLSNSNNYTNAQVLYNNTQNNTANQNTLNNAFKTSSTNPIILVSSNIESTYGGSSLTQAQLTNQKVLGSASNPYNFLLGYQGQGTYELTTTSGSQIVEQISNQYDYNNSNLATFYALNPQNYAIPQLSVFR